MAQGPQDQGIGLRLQPGGGGHRLRQPCKGAVQHLGSRLGVSADSSLQGSGIRDQGEPEQGQLHQLHKGAGQHLGSMSLCILGVERG